MILDLPFPPSNNRYYRRVGPRTLISREGRAYRKQVAHCVGAVDSMEGRLEVSVWVYPPDRRRRDLDNLFKALLDAMEHAGVYLDDSQIDRLSISRGEPTRQGAVKVRLRDLGGHAHG